jgi:hypothetical protein
VAADPVAPGRAVLPVVPLLLVVSLVPMWTSASLSGW